MVYEEESISYEVKERESASVTVSEKLSINVIISILIAIFLSVGILFFSLIIIHVLINSRVFIFTIDSIPVQIESEIDFMGIKFNRIFILDVCIGLLFFSFIVMMGIILFLLYIRK